MLIISRHLKQPLDIHYMFSNLYWIKIIKDSKRVGWLVVWLHWRGSFIYIYIYMYFFLQSLSWQLYFYCLHTLYMFSLWSAYSIIHCFTDPVHFLCGSVYILSISGLSTRQNHNNRGYLYFLDNNIHCRWALHSKLT